MIKKHGLTVILLIIIFSTRALIFNKDATYFWADERQYGELITALDKSRANNNYMIAFKTIFRLNARPALGLFYYPAAFLEWKNPNIPYGAYFNIIVNSLSLIVVYLTLKKVLSEKSAFITTLIVTLSISSVVYIRHLLPYDIAFFLLLLAFYIYVRTKKVFIFGLLAGLSFLSYPGVYDYLFPIPITLFLYYRSFKKMLFFVMGMGAILLFTQLAYFLAGETTLYFHSLQNESGGPTDYYGDYMPAAYYISEYIHAVDGYWNLFLILTIFLGIFFIKDKKKIVFFAAYLILVFLSFELFSHILRKHVLYGRTIRPLYLLALGLAVLVLEKVFSNFKSKKMYMFCVSVLILASIINWLPKFLVYKNLVYPKQFQQKARDYLNSKYGDKYEVEDALFFNLWDSEDPDPKLIWHFFKPGEPGKYYAMNASQAFPYYGNFNMDQFCKAKVLFKEPHIQYTFRPYLFEGHKIIMRERMKKNPLYYQLIYCK